MLSQKASGFETCLITSRTSTVGTSTIFSCKLPTLYITSGLELEHYKTRAAAMQRRKASATPIQSCSGSVLVNYLRNFHLGTRVLLRCWQNCRTTCHPSTIFSTYWISSFSTCKCSASMAAHAATHGSGNDKCGHEGWHNCVRHFLLKLRARCSPSSFVAGVAAASQESHKWCTLCKKQCRSAVVEHSCQNC